MIWRVRIKISIERAFVPNGSSLGKENEIKLDPASHWRILNLCPLGSCTVSCKYVWIQWCFNFKMHHVKSAGSIGKTISAHQFKTFIQTITQRGHSFFLQTRLRSILQNCCIHRNTKTSRLIVFVCWKNQWFYSQITMIWNYFIEYDKFQGFHHRRRIWSNTRHESMTYIINQFRRTTIQ